MRRLTVEWDDPMTIATATRGMAGIDALRLVMAGELPQPPIGRLLDFRLIEVEPGRATFEGTPGEQHYNPIGMVHGGFALTLLDSAMGCAIHSTLPAGAAYTTLEVKTNFVRPLTKDTGPVRCEARIIHGGRRSAIAEGRVVDAGGKLYAHGTTTCMVFPAPD